MNEAVMALDMAEFRWFDLEIKYLQMFPKTFGKADILAIYPSMVQIVLKMEGNYGGKEKIELIQEIHNEYLEIIAAFDAERGEKHEAPTINTAGQTYREASGGYESNADMAL